MTSHTPHKFPGRRSFIAGSLLLILFGLAHTVAVLKEAFSPSTETKMMALNDAMRECHVQVGPVTCTVWGMVQILSHSYSILLVGLGITGLLVVRPMAMVGRLRAITALNIMLCGALAMVSVLWMFPPPLILGGLALAAFCSSMARQVMLNK